jgi:hypothetical protein
MESQLAAYKTGAIDSPDLIEADIYFVRDYRNAINSHYNSLIKLDDLERISLGNVESSYSEEEFSISAETVEMGVILSLKTDVPHSEITSVTYSLADKKQGDLKVFNSDRSFAISVASNEKKTRGHATIIFANGEALRKKF